MSFRILLVEDEAGLVLTLTDLLIDAGYEVDAATDGESGLAMALKNTYDLIILDVMLPKMTGFEVCRILRQQGAASEILMLTARTEVGDRVHGLELGADDYVTKPFEPAELLARIQARLRRVANQERAMNRFSFGNVVVNFDRAELRKAGQPVTLTGKELQLLQYLVENRGKVLAREDILREVWNYNSDVASRTLDVHIAWLRQKLESDPQVPSYIHTVRGIGYRFSP